jgi:hypothetical protein
VILFALSLSARAWAFADASQFFDAKQMPHAATFGASSEGIYFTGAPRFVSQSCAACHTDGPGRVAIKLGADQPSLFTDGYQPGTTYLLEVELLGETAGLEYNTPTCTDPPTGRDTFTYVQCNNNGFALEIDSAAGPLAGPTVFCAAQPVFGICPKPDVTNDEAVVAPDGDAVFDFRARDAANPKTLTRNGQTRWHLWWTAPQAGSGPLTVYVGGVDGNGGGGTADNDQDPYGDDTVQAVFTLEEAGAPAPSGATAGCALEGHAARSGALLGVALLGAIVLHLRRRRA